MPQQKKKIQRVRGLWYSDGNIIIEAGRKQFRVYTGKLAEHSPVFKDMFALPQPSDQETYKDTGHPLLRMEDDPEDVECLLRTCFDTTYLVDAHDSYDKTISMVRVSTKYDLPFVFKYIVGHIELEFPTTLPEYTESSGRSTVAHYAFELANLASRIGLPGRILPALLLRCCCAPLKELLEGTPGHDGVIIPLDSHHRNTCILAREEFLSWQRTTFCAWLWEGSCTQQACISVRRRNGGTAAEDSVADSWTFTAWHWDSFIDGGCCRKCVDKAREELQESQQALWSSLPGMFGLRPWDELSRVEKGKEEEEEEDSESGEEDGDDMSTSA